jgi:mannose-1-phosphate guanylyltransferase/mannose-6-phosphate isomerase
LFAVIMAGGSGTRFWPLSREKMPKQLLRIGGDDTLIQQTVERILPLVRAENVFIVTNRGLADDIGLQLAAKFGSAWERGIILEPEARNTAPAIGLAALQLLRVDPEATMIVLSADHAIRKGDELIALLERAARAAAAGYLVTLGIHPDRPETGYGYIKAGAAVDGVCSVEAFKEKPDLETARGYLRDGGYYWNSGIFVWKAAVLLEEFGKHAPELRRGLEAIRAGLGTPDEERVIREVFARLETISIDYAVMEKTDRARVIPADIGWSDVGSWTALDDVSPRDAAGNVISGNVIDIDSRDTIVYADKRLVATIGLRGFVVVDTPDAVLVCPKDRAQDVKKVVDGLRKRKSGEILVHRTVHRPWGSYTVLEEGENYKIKHLLINPGSKLSLQLHHHRSEHWVVVSGTARVTNGEQVFDVHPNESTYIPMSTQHRLENQGKIPLRIVEVQNGEYLEEDDIVRLDDDYHRHDGARRSLPDPGAGGAGRG